MNDKPNFFDGRTLGAIAIVFAAWMGWQYYMQKKYPDAFKQTNENTIVENPSAKSDGESADQAPSDTVNVAATPEEPKAVLSGAPAQIESVKESILAFESPTLNFEISSTGMGIRNIHLKKFTDRDGSIIEIGASSLGKQTFETRLLGQTKSLPFELTKVNERSRHRDLFVLRIMLGA